MTVQRHSLHRSSASVARLAFLLQKRNAVASAEPEDAAMTGMTRSLDRRLLALNLRPVAAEWSNLTIKAA